MIDPTNRNTALASALVEELARCGVRHAILSPGSRSTPLALALDREPAIELDVILDERVAGFVALGSALASGLPAVVACTSGTAAAQYLPAVAEADRAGVPLIALTSDRPPELRGIGAGQTIDQIGLYGTATRWFCEVGTHEAGDEGMLHYRATACRAYAEAVRGRGPVHLNLAWRDPLGPEPRPGEVGASGIALEGRADGRPLTEEIACREPDANVVERVADAIAKSERALIVAGRDPRAGLPEAVLELARAAGLPILAEPTSQLRAAPRAEGVIAHYDAILRSPPSRLVPELVLRFGDLPTSKSLRGWLAAGEAEQIVIDPPGAWDDATRRAGSLIRADATALAKAVAAGVSPAPAGWRAAWAEADEVAAGAIDAVLASPEGDQPLGEPHVHRALGRALAAGDQVLFASSMPIRDAESFLPAGLGSVRCFANRGANGIDGTIATACGLARGGRAPTWVVLGDLALAHDLGGLAALATVDVPLRILVIDNGGGGIFNFLPQAGQLPPERFERLFTTPSPLELERVAGLFSVPFATVHTEEDLLALADHDRVLARIPVDRAANVALHERLWAAVAAAVPA